jgi:hypothetical protein
MEKKFGGNISVQMSMFSKHFEMQQQYFDKKIFLSKCLFIFYRNIVHKKVVSDAGLTVIISMLVLYILNEVGPLIRKSQSTL